MLKNTAKLESFHIQYLLGCLLFLSCDSKPNSFPASYSGWHIETEWAFHFRDNGTLTLELNGHINVDTTEGTYLRFGDTLWLSFADSFHQKNFERDFFLLSGDTALIDFRAGYSFAKEGFSTNFIPVAYPETYPYVAKGSPEEKFEIGRILEQILNDDKLKSFLQGEEDTVMLTGNFLDLSDQVPSLNESFRREGVTFKWDPLFSKISKEDYIEFNDFKYDSLVTWVWLGVYQNEKYTNLLAQFRKHDGEWRKVFIR